MVEGSAFHLSWRRCLTGLARIQAEPYGELMARLQALTNLQVVEDGAMASGWKVEIGPFSGWKDVPTW